MSTYSNRLSQVSKTYYVFFGSSTQDRHARRCIYRRSSFCRVTGFTSDFLRFIVVELICRSRITEIWLFTKLIKKLGMLLMGYCIVFAKISVVTSIFQLRLHTNQYALGSIMSVPC